MDRSATALGLTFVSALADEAHHRRRRATSGHANLTRAILHAHDLLELEAVVLPALRSFAELAAVALVVPGMNSARVLVDGRGEPAHAVEAAARWIAGDASTPETRRTSVRPARYRLRAAASWLVYVPLPGTTFAHARDRARAAEPLLALGVRRLVELELLRHQVVTDPLTGLYNRRYFSAALETALETVTRSPRALSVLAIDLDGFKQLNDEHGHVAGDRALMRFGEILRAETRQVDVVARMGGDEFAVVMRGATHAEARAAARRVLGRLRDGPIPLGASIGVATYPPLPASPAELIRAADAAMYRAKQRTARTRRRRAARPAPTPRLRRVA